MVFGLEMLFRMGQDLAEPDIREHRTLATLLGLALMGAGWLGWMTGHALQAAVSRQREYLADARAVQWTRSRDAIGGVLRKIMTQQREGAERRRIGSMVQHMLLVGSESGKVAGWFDSHPTLEQRVRRIYGRAMPAMPLPKERDQGAPSAFRTAATDDAGGPGWTMS